MTTMRAGYSAITDWESSCAPSTFVKTQSGLEGIGESWGRLPENDPSSRYIGSSAFDWIGDTRNLAINMAVYDLMGKYLGLPCWKLIGPRVRSWVPVAAWTASQPPEGMAEEALNVAGRGFHWLKYHVDVIQNAVDQTEAIQKVAPPGFKVHYDFNADSNLEAVEPVLKELEKFSVAGRIEDPLRAVDHEGYRILREKCSIPILIHHGPADYFMRHGLCDGFMAGHAPVGHAAKLAGMAESANTPFMLQQCGGNHQPGLPGPRGRGVQDGHSGSCEPLSSLEGRRDGGNHARGERQRAGAWETGTGGNPRP